MSDARNIVSLKKLEPLLQKSFDDGGLKVIDFETLNLLPPGENHASFVHKLEVKIKRGNSTNEENLHLIAKVQNENPTVIGPAVFKKEAFVYTELMLAYRDMELDVGFNENDLIDILPKYVGHGHLIKEVDQEIENGCFILMENLKVQGYDSVNRYSGLDFNSAKIALMALARYHALGIALKTKRPEFFKKTLPYAQISTMNYHLLDKGFEGVLEDFENMPEYKKHWHTIESVFDDARDGKMFKAVPEEPWATITHGDFWVNNLLFRKNEKGEVDDVKIIDFQMYLYESPLKDLPYFFCGSLDDYTLTNHFDDLLNVYYDSFISTLRRMGCGTDRYSKEAFHAELKKQARKDFTLVVLATKFFFLEVDLEKSGEISAENVLQMKCSDLCRSKFMRLVKLYEERQWFS